jgi:hypothetical protein
MNGVKSSTTSTDFVVEDSSSKKTDIQPLFCYECAGYHRVSYMQSIPCVICGGRKCYNHGGEALSTCRECGQTDMCGDCSAFGKCCHEFVGTEYVNKKTGEVLFTMHE